MDVPDKPGLYWVYDQRSHLHLVKISGKSPFFNLHVLDVDEFKYPPYRLVDLTNWQWLGPANAPGQEDGT